MRHRNGTYTRIAFDALSIEGALLPADWLAKVAQLDADAQTPHDYRIPTGLQIRDEIARSWRIAQACFSEMEAGRASGGSPRGLALRFAEAFLRDALHFSSLHAASPLVAGERAYPVSFATFDDHVPVVVAPLGEGLDTPLAEFGDEGRRRSAFGLLQEALNASADALWGLATDGVTLRIARDNASLTRPAWIEADLARMFAEDLFPDFAALWLVAHESRFGSVNGAGSVARSRPPGGHSGARQAQRRISGCARDLWEGIPCAPREQGVAISASLWPTFQQGLLRAAPASRVPLRLPAHSRRTGPAARRRHASVLSHALRRRLFHLPPAGPRHATKRP